MSYTQPNAYVNNNPLDANDITKNEESLKLYVNQEIVSGDYSTTDEFSKLDITKGLIVQNNASFESCDVNGINQLQLVLNRSYQTSTTKNNNQTSSIQWQDIANSGVVVNVDSTAELLITMYVKYTVLPNSAIPANQGQGNGLWQNEIRLKRYNIIDGTYANFLSTDTYCFEGIGSTSDTKDPGNDLENANHRSLMIAIRTTISTPGVYAFTATVNPHNEVGYATVKSMTAEVFYI